MAFKLDLSSALKNIQDLVGYGSISNRDIAMKREQEAMKSQQSAKAEMEKAIASGEAERKRKAEEDKKRINERLGLLNKELAMVQKATNTNKESPTPFSENAGRMKSIREQMDSVIEEGKKLLWPNYQGQEPGAVLGASSEQLASPSAALEPYSPNITIPGKDGKPYTLDPGLAQMFLNSFNDIGEATNAAQVLSHPREQTYTPEEIKRIGEKSFNYGENPDFNQYADTSLQENNTWDTGFARLNSGTIKEMLDSAYWANKLKEKGITDFAQLSGRPENTQRNLDAARTRFEYGNWEDGALSESPNWRHWYAAPLRLRTK